MLRLEPVNNPSRSQGTTRVLRVLSLSTLLCLSVTAAACGGDDSDDPAPTAGASGAAAGSGGAGGASGATAPAPVACGTIQCFAPTSPISGILGMFGGALGGALPTPTACCLDEAAETCGVKPNATGACEPLASTDSRCPKAELGMLGGFINIAPCCNADNQCGQDGRIFGRGCVENTQVAAMLGPLAMGGGFAFPPSRSCDAPVTPTTPDEDAGVADSDGGI